MKPIIQDETKEKAIFFVLFFSFVWTLKKRVLINLKWWAESNKNVGPNRQLSHEKMVQQLEMLSGNEEEKNLFYCFYHWRQYLFFIIPLFQLLFQRSSEGKEGNHHKYLYT